MSSLVLFYDPNQVHYSDILSYFLGVSTSQLKFERNLFGKPYLLDYEMFFNVSHTSDAAVLVIDKSHEVGIDIENRQRIIRAHNKFLHLSEYQALSSFQPQNRQEAIIQLICIKEAILKAKGIGLLIQLESLDLSPFIGQRQFIYTSDLLEEQYQIRCWKYQNYSIVLAIAI